jgi:hypothetical protein
MMTDGRLVDTTLEQIHKFVDAQPRTAQMLHDLLTGLIRQCFAKTYRINAHAIIISIIIDMSSGG